MSTLSRPQRPKRLRFSRQDDRVFCPDRADRQADMGARTARWRSVNLVSTACYAGATV